MTGKHASARSVFRTSCIISFALLAGSCSFQHGIVPFRCQDYDAIPFTPLIAQASQTVFENFPQFIAIHGSGTAELAKGKSADAIKVEQSVDLPPFVDRATVFLNGWRLAYLGSDQHVLALGAAITRIRMEVDSATKRSKLVWNALGMLRDEDGEEGYSFKYEFTVFAWDDGSIAANIDHGNGNNQFCGPTGIIQDNWYLAYNQWTTTALSSAFSFIKNTVFAPAATVAVLPRGFGFTWLPGVSGLDATFGDHHLLQIAYDLDHSEVFADGSKTYSTKDLSTPALPNGTSVTAGGFVSWNTKFIYKDNETRRDYGFGEVVSAMAGNDVGLIHPPFSPLPIEKLNSIGSVCTSGARGLSQDFVIENVPFELRIPMLTGWELEYQSSCGDQHVKTIGIWIDHWSYDPPSGSAGGTLHYTLQSVLHDDDSVPFFFPSHRVSILGIKPIVGSIKARSIGK
jgi:hypothetical protein